MCQYAGVMDSTSRSCCVLLSGGVDSALVASLLAADGWSPNALWVDYGQPAAVAERAASRVLATYHGIDWKEVKVPGMEVPQAGEITARNDLLVAIGRAFTPNTSLAIGIHSGTPYADCSVDWLSAWNTVIDVQHYGVISLLAPLVNLTKAEIFALSHECKLPIELTYSCEVGPSPCGRCLSCLDREVALAGA